MELYLIRHGIAGDRDPVKYPNDDKRPLTDGGRQKTKKVAQRLHELGLRFDLILTSPLVRAYQTAEILQKRGCAIAQKHLSPSHLMAIFKIGCIGSQNLNTIKKLAVLLWWVINQTLGTGQRS